MGVVLLLLKLFLGALGALFLIMVALLCLPFHYDLRLTLRQKVIFSGDLGQRPLYSLGFIQEGTRGDPALTVRLAGLSFSLSPDSIPGRGKGSPPPREKRKKGKGRDKGLKKSEKGESPGLREAKPFIRKEYLQHVLSLGVDLINMARPRYLSVKGQVGFGEPHHTGLLLAALGSLEGIIPSLELDFQPVWIEEYYDLEISTGGRLVPAGALVRLTRFLISARTLKIWRTYRQAKKASGKPTGASAFQ